MIDGMLGGSKVNDISDSSAEFELGRRLNERNCTIHFATV